MLINTKNYVDIRLKYIDSRMFEYVLGFMNFTHKYGDIIQI